MKYPVLKSDSISTLITNIKDRGILIVDDDSSFRDFLYEALKNEGYTRIFTASNGVECLSILASYGHEIYAVLLDLKMPQMDAVQVVRHLANVHKYSVGIVIITAYGTDENAAEFLCSGSETVLTVDYLDKCTDLADILDEVRNTLELIHNKRVNQIFEILGELNRGMADIKSEISVVQKELGKLSDINASIHDLSKHVSVPSQIGIQVIVNLLLMVFVIAVMYFGLTELLDSVIQDLP